MRWFVLIAWLLGGAMAAQGAEPPPVWKVRDFAVDADGMVWGIASPAPTHEWERYAVPERLALLNPSAGLWRPHPCTAVPDEAVAKNLVVLSNGTVACLWQAGETTILTRHSKAGDELWNTLAVSFNEPRLLALSDGGLVITGRGPDVARLGAKTGDAVLAVVADELLTAPENEERSRSYAMIHAVEAGDGSLWMWSYSLKPKPSLWRIGGFVRWADGRMTKPEDLPVPSDAAISAVLADGRSHLYVAEAGVGLHRLDLAGGRPELFTGPAEKELRYIEKLFWLNGKLHLVTCPQHPDSEVEMSGTLQGHLVTRTINHYDTSQRACCLWRRDGGNLTLLIQGLEMGPDLNWVDRPFASSSRGWLLATCESGPWWLPSDDSHSPFLLDLQQGFNLQRTAGLAVVGSEFFLCRAPDFSWSLLPLPGVKPRDSATRLTTLVMEEFMLQDKRHDLWSMGKAGSTLTKWNGKTDEEQTLPDSLKSVDTVEFAEDNSDQGWLIPRNAGLTGVLDFKTGHWSVFPTLEEAVATRLAAGDRLRMRRYPVFSPVAAPDGGKGFVAWDGSVHVLRDGQWTSVALSSLGVPDARISGTPSFGEDGFFRLPVNGRHYAKGLDGIWGENSSGSDSGDFSYTSINTVAPPESDLKGILSNVPDRHGVAWVVTEQGTLWKWLDGVAVQILDFGRPVLFRPGTITQEVLCDTRGNAFLRHQEKNNRISYSMLRASTEWRKGAATLSSVEGNSVRIVPAEAPGGWFRWRLDGAAWQKPEPFRELRLEHQKRGEHRLEIQSFDHELTPASEPQVLEFTIQPVSENALSALLHQLTDPGMREFAAREIAAQGAGALPMLKGKLGVTVDTNLQWWLRAVIQQIERDAEGKR